MKWHVLKGVLPIGLLAGLAVPTDAIAQAPTANTTQAHRLKGANLLKRRNLREPATAEVLRGALVPALPSEPGLGHLPAEVSEARRLVALWEQARVPYITGA